MYTSLRDRTRRLPRATRVVRAALALLACTAASCAELRSPVLSPLSEAAKAPSPVSLSNSFLQRNWEPREWKTFHALSQGTVTVPVPYAWLVAFEVPGIFEQERLVSTDHLKRFGFFYDPIEGEETLPIGFGRIDTIGRIGDQVFGTSLSPRNDERLEAPVSFPPIWHSSWFRWVHCNGSIMQPMVRNAGEALGVSALINLQGLARDLYASTLEFDNLAVLEQLLAGEAPFEGLTSPPWPEEILGSIDRDSAEYAHERALYEQRCQACHLPPANDLALARPGAPVSPRCESAEPQLFVRVSCTRCRPIALHVVRS